MWLKCVVLRIPSRRGTAPMDSAAGHGALLAHFSFFVVYDDFRLKKER